MLDKITESGMDALMNRIDRWSRIMAWAAVAGAVIFILIPAVMTICMR